MVRLLLLPFQQSLQSLYLPILHPLWFIVLRYLFVKKLFILLLLFQGDPIELHRKRQGCRPDHFEHKRKKEACEVHKRSAFAQKALGIKRKMFAKKRYEKKALMKNT